MIVKLFALLVPLSAAQAIADATAAIGEEMLTRPVVHYMAISVGLSGLRDAYIISVLLTAPLVRAFPFFVNHRALNIISRPLKPLVGLILAIFPTGLFFMLYAILLATVGDVVPREIARTYFRDIAIVICLVSAFFVLSPRLL
jgi:hypothetical protein